MPKAMKFRPERSQLLPRGYFSFPEIAGQNAWLDVLRSVAILLVLFRHGERAITIEAGSSAPASGPLHSLFMNGWVGVDLFLVLSGYLIGKSLIRTFDADRTIGVRTYFRARVLRIVPAYLFVLLVVAAGAFPFYVFPQDDLGRRLLYHVLFLQDYLPADINVVFWSLGVEEKFYLLAPVLLFCLLKAKNQVHALCLLLALFLLSPAIKFFQFLSAAETSYETFFAVFRSPFHLSLEPLVAGVAISYIREKKLVRLSTGAAWLLFAFAGIAMSAWLMSHEFLKSITLFDATVQPVLIALLFGSMALSATCLNSSPAPGMAFWRPVSRLSYSLYLVHFPLIPLCAAVSPTTQLAGASFWVVYVAVSFAAAAWLHFAVEKPFLLLKDRRPGATHAAVART
jgi:peptidoglycan/LPS O-acetylase OafA/YrhL